MSSLNRKKRILDHLAKSAGGFNYVEPSSNPPDQSAPTSPTQATEIAPETAPTPAFAPTTPISTQTDSKVPSASSIAERKRQVLDHVRQTSEPLVDLTLPDKSKQKRIQDHLKKSLN